MTDDELRGAILMFRAYAKNAPPARTRHVNDLADECQKMLDGKPTLLTREMLDATLRLAVKKLTELRG